MSGDRHVRFDRTVQVKYEEPPEALFEPTLRVVLVALPASVVVTHAKPPFGQETRLERTVDQLLKKLSDLDEERAQWLREKQVLAEARQQDVRGLSCLTTFRMPMPPVLGRHHIHASEIDSG